MSEDSWRPANLQALVDLLNSQAGLRIYKKAFRGNMLHKVERYSDLLARSHHAVASARALIDIKVPELKEAAGLDPADSSHNWAIFESISAPYQAAQDQASQFAAVLARARARLTGTMAVDRVTSDDTVKDLRDDLVAALDRLSNFSAQPHIVSKVVDIVSSFLKDQRLVRSRLMNLMMLGSAGTGKTSIAEAIGDVLAKAGLFVGNNLIVAGRGDLVGQYLGETVAKTRAFLTSHLDDGVIFLDEAYALTPWEDGKPESYGTEAATAMVDFITRFPGLYCIITAGYEREMTRYFLPSNEGLSRRFPYKFVLRDMTPEELLIVFKRQLLHAQGLPVPNGRDAVLASERYFSRDAYDYLETLIRVSLDGDVVYAEEFDRATRRTYPRVRTFRPRWEHLHQLFEHFAGSMTNLADEAVTVLMTTIRFEDVVAAQRKRGRHARPALREQGVAVMRRIIVQRICSIALSNADAFLRQLEQVEARL